MPCIRKDRFHHGRDPGRAGGDHYIYLPWDTGIPGERILGIWWGGYRRSGGWNPHLEIVEVVETMKNRRSYFDTCPYCGGTLDPGEACDCRSRNGREYTSIEGLGYQVIAFEELEQVPVPQKG